MAKHIFNGQVYGETNIPIDETLKISGHPADAKAVGDAFAKHENRIDTNQSNISSVEDMICDTEFSTSDAYAVGDIVTHEHGLYKFTSAHSAGDWNSSEVSEVSVVGIIGNINTVLEEVL